MSEDPFTKSLSVISALIRKANGAPPGPPKGGATNGRAANGKGEGPGFVTGLVLGAAVGGVVGAVVGAKTKVIQNGNGSHNGKAVLEEAPQELKATLAETVEAISQPPLNGATLKEAPQVDRAASGGAGMARFHGRIAIEDLPEGVKAQEWKTPPRWLPSTLHSLAYANFLFLWLAQITNSLSLWMEQVARPVLVLMVTGSGVQLGLVVAARGLPQLFLSPVAGVVADRFDRRKVILVSKSLGMVVNFAFAIVIITGQLELWHIYASSILRSMLNAFDNPARQALIPNLVPPNLLVNAIAVNSGSMQLVRILAASIAGFSIAFVGIGGTFLIIALVSVVAVVFTYMMQVPHWGRVSRRQESWIGSMIDGFRYALKEKAIFAILVLLTFQSIFGQPYLQIFVPLIALQFMDFSFLGEFGVEPNKAHEVGLGLLLAASGFGALLGSLIVATIGERLRHRGFIVIGGLTLYGLAVTALGLSSLTGLMILPFLFVSIVGVGQTLLLTVKNAILMELTPNDMRGRVFAIQSLDRGLSTIGASGGGFLAAAVGAPIGLAIYGAAVAVGAIWVGIFMPALRRVD
ncbi:MAG: transporter [Dehalococcoidia bacterium]|nr:transporter [Dehalococcoidia bacterium]